MKRRGKGEGSITRLPNGHLKITITLGVGVDGKQKRKSVTAKTKTELMQRVHDLRVATGTSIKDTPPYFKDVVRLFLKHIEGTLRPSTANSYQRSIELIFQPLYDFRIDKITPEMIDNILDNLKTRQGKPMAPMTIKNHKGRLSALFHFALEQGIVSSSPIPRTKKRTHGNLKVNTILIPTETQIQELLKEAKEQDSKEPEGDFRLYPFFLLAVTTGARFGELLDIDKVSDIDIEHNTIDINSQVTREGAGQPLKTSTSYRRIYVQPEVLRAILKEAPSSNKTTKLWTHHDRPISYMTASMRVFKFLSRCTVVPEGFTFHCFRHYHATYLLLHNINVKEVSKRLGHSSITTTLDLYAHWVPEMDASAANTVGNKFIL